MTIHIFVVSHNHGKIIQRLQVLENFAKQGVFNLCIKNNCPDKLLSNYAKVNNIRIVNKPFGLGFGANNNHLFRLLSDKGEIALSDFIVILNPDVDISVNALLSLIDKMSHNNDGLATINLFKDREKSVYDNSIRRWPSLFDFIFSFLKGINRSIINKHEIKEATSVDWCAGSFLAMSASLYRRLNGFDERFFMYCEDIDICYRAMELGIKVKYYPDICAIHFAAHASRRFCTKHFYWHVKSALLFLTRAQQKNTI